jgi:hypothetical protein
MMTVPTPMWMPSGKRKARMASHVRRAMKITAKYQA